MISKEEVKKLADLARIEIGEEEAESLSKDMDAILDYVGQVSHVASQSEAMRNGFDENQIQNVMREDEDANMPGSSRKELIAEFPKGEKDYLKVKKIL